MNISLFVGINKQNNSNPLYTKGLSKNQKIKFGSKNIVSEVFPDLKQFWIPKKKKFFCGPVSVANGIIQLANEGFSNLFSSNNPIQLIEELSKHFRTTNKGTTMNDYCRGIERFVAEKGYRSEIQYEGFRDVSKEYKVGDLPDLELIKDAIEKGKAVFMNIGAYTRETKSKKHIYKRKEGHYVTVVGTDKNGGLIIHDPYNKTSGDLFVQTEKLHKGKMRHNKDDNEGVVIDNAKGFYKIWPFNYLSQKETAIINGVVTLGIK